MAKRKIHFTLIILIFFLGLILRFFNLATMPPALNWDEVSHGYNAYSILKNGKDEWGQFMPLANFRAYGDYPLPVNLYITIPSISLFGLNEFGIRAPHAFMGALTILACFFLAQGIGFSVGISLLAALLVAISPWTLFPSRFVVQSNVSLFFITTGMALFFHRKKRAFFLPLAALALGISVYSYHNARIFVPLLIVALAFLYQDEWKRWWQKKRIYLIVAILLLLVFFVPLVPILLGSEGRARAHWVSIIDEGAINQIIEDRLQSNLPEFLTRLVYNRPTYFLTHFFINYLGYFSPRFLFFKGGTQYQFSVPGRGVLYPVEMPFFYLGLGFLVFWVLIKKKKFAQAVLLWLLLAPIPAALTRGGSHVIRASTILPLPQILSALGVFQLTLFIQKRKKTGQILLVAFLLTIFISFFSYLNAYFGSYRQDYSWSWQYGYKEVANYIQSHYNDYDKIFITKKYGEPHEFLLFYLKWDPEKYRSDPYLIRYFKTDWYWVDSFDKFVFVNDWEISGVRSQESGARSLLITSPGNYPEGWSKIKTIDFLDGSSAFEILER
ncbi:phospholipid carrier-dependent glycosyltransferase [Patescibacteria group bacterium]|nr:phospholipid carrier-dependent glycosyltransferase [Patescibacteria group bacterium]